MNPTLADSIKAILANFPNIPKKYSMWVVALASAAGTIWLGLPVPTQAEYLALYPWLQYIPLGAASLAAIGSAMHQNLPVTTPGDIAAAKKVSTDSLPPLPPL